MIIQANASIITRNPVMAVTTKACSIRSIAIAAPFPARTMWPLRNRRALVYVNRRSPLPDVHIARRTLRDVSSRLRRAPGELQANAGGGAGDDGELIGGHGAYPCDGVMTPNHSAAISPILCAAKN